MKFSAQEKLVLKCLITGATDKQIAARLGTTPGGIRSTMRHLLGKIGVANRTQAAVWAWRHTEIIHNGLMNGQHYEPTLDAFDTWRGGLSADR